MYKFFEILLGYVLCCFIYRWNALLFCNIADYTTIKDYFLGLLEKKKFITLVNILF